MRCLLLLLVWSVSFAAQGQSYQKKKKAVRDGSVQLWDGSDADVAWVNENTLPPRRVVKPYNPWLSFSFSGGHRLFRADDKMVVLDQDQKIMSEGLFLDLIQPVTSVEVRSLLHVFSFLSLGVNYHVDEAKLKVNQQTVPLAPQELSGSVHVGPRLGRVRIYGFYNHLISSRFTTSVQAPTVASDGTAQQDFSVDIKQTGGEAGIGTQVRWGMFGIFAEAMQSVHRTFDLDIKAKNGTNNFHATAKPSFKAWQLGLALEF